MGPTQATAATGRACVSASRLARTAAKCRSTIPLGFFASTPRWRSISRFNGMLSVRCCALACEGINARGCPRLWPLEEISDHMPGALIAILCVAPRACYPRDNASPHIFPVPVESDGVAMAGPHLRPPARRAGSTRRGQKCMLLAALRNPAERLAPAGPADDALRAPHIGRDGTSLILALVVRRRVLRSLSEHGDLGGPRHPLGDMLLDAAAIPAPARGAASRLTMRLSVVLRE